MSDRSQRPPYTSLTILALILAALFVCTHAERRENTDSEKPEASIQPLEKFGTLTDIAFLAEGGREVRLRDFKGKPVVLNLWATWCGPCVEEMPSLDRLQRDFPGVEVVAVSLDKQGEEKVREFLAEEGLKHLAIYADPSMNAMAALGVPGIPATFLIARDGTEVGGINGAYDWDSPEARAAVASLLPKADGDADAGKPLEAQRRAPEPPNENRIVPASMGP